MKSRQTTGADGPRPTDVTGRVTKPRDLDLDTFFRPRSIAVIGASNSERKPNTAMWRKVKAWGETFGATVTPVNPKFTELDGVPCVPTIADVPGPVDLAAILVGDALPMFEQVAATGARYAVVFGAGFAEIGGEGVALQNRLDALVRASGTHLLGPNTNLNAFETFTPADGRKLCLITQSGHQGRPVFQSQDLGVAMSHWAPAGNEVDLEFADFAEYFSSLPDTGVVAAYIEGFKDGRTLQLAADSMMRRGIPLVMVKVGRTDEGSSMAASHTGHLTGSDTVTDAVFRQYGVTRVDGLDELTELSAMFCRTVAPPPGRAAERRVCIYAISGGTGAHMADMCAAEGLALPDLTEATQAELRKHIPGYLRVSNPVDSGGAPSGDERGRMILDAIVADPNVDAVIVPITGALASMSHRFATDLAEVSRTTDKPILVVWGSPMWDPEYTDILMPGGVPTFRTFRNCVRGARAWFDFWATHERWTSPFAEPITERSAAAAAVQPLLRAGATLSEHDSKAVLAAYGIPVTRDVLCRTAADAADAFTEFGGPVVIKIASADIAHKSDLGLVRVGIESAAAASACWGEFMTIAAQRAPGAVVDGVLVCETAPKGVETLIGVSTDELFGPTVAFGLGGTLVEVFEDVTVRVPPFDRDEARRMIDETRVARLLAGARGAPTADIDAVLDMIMAIQRLAMDFADPARGVTIAEIDINPFVVTRDGAVALDALVVCGRS